MTAIVTQVSNESAAFLCCCINVDGSRVMVGGADGVCIVLELFSRVPSSNTRSLTSVTPRWSAYTVRATVCKWRLSGTALCQCWRSTYHRRVSTASAAGIFFLFVAFDVSHAAHIHHAFCHWFHNRCSADGSVKVWDLQTMMLKGLFAAHPKNCNCARYRPSLALPNNTLLKPTAGHVQLRLHCRVHRHRRRRRPRSNVGARCVGGQVDSGCVLCTRVSFALRGSCCAVPSASGHRDEAPTIVNQPQALTPLLSYLVPALFHSNLVFVLLFVINRRLTCARRHGPWCVSCAVTWAPCTPSYSTATAPTLSAAG